jgi:putative ABC transport system permease protein
MGAVVALVAALVVVVSGFTNGLTDDTVSAVESLDATHLVFSADAHSSQFTRSVLEARTWQAWASRPGLRATPFGTVLAHGRAAGPGRAPLDVDLALFGVAPASFLAPTPVEGDGVDDRGIVISRQLADRGVRIGDTVTFDRLALDVPVVGITGRSSFGHVPAAYAPLGLWRQARFGVPGRPLADQSVPDAVTGVAVQGPPGWDPGPVDADLGTRTITRAKAFAAAPGYEGETTIMSTIRVFLYVISALVIGAFFVVLAVERRSETAIVKALGGSARYIITGVLGEVLLLLVPSVFIGGALATALGLLLQRAVPFRQDLPSITAVCALLVLTGATAAAVTTRRAASADPLLALGMNR